MKLRYTEDELRIIWIDSFKGLDYQKKSKLVFMTDKSFPNRNYLEKNRADVIAAVGEDNFKELYEKADNDYLLGVLSELEKKGITVLTVKSEAYPELLWETDDCPVAIYCKGNTELLNGRLFGIVGSRKNIPLSLSIAKNYAEALIKAGFIPVTGTADGIDKEVLTTALSMGKHCVSVVAGGFDHIYPASNAELIGRIADNGLIISEQPPCVSPMPWSFPQRNRIIAGLCEGVLIVSGDKKSGALITAEKAEGYGRFVFSVPYSVGIPCGEGCNDLIKKGAVLTDTPDDILGWFNISFESEKEEELTDEERAVFNEIANGNSHIEKICGALGKMVFEITPVISLLEIKGFVVKSGVNEYAPSKNNSEA